MAAESRMDSGRLASMHLLKYLRKCKPGRQSAHQRQHACLALATIRTQNHSPFTLPH
jgi:hypothetical protein